MESIDKLREYAHDYDGTISSVRMRECADEIEREIAERYMELPVDADGVPIHPGNRVELDGKGGEVWLVGTTDVMCNDGMSFRAVAVSHVKPRTLEDVLRDCVMQSMTVDRVVDGIPVLGIDETMFGDWIAENEDELRELLRGDAE